MIYSKIMIKLMQIKAPKSRPIRLNWIEYEHFWYTYKRVSNQAGLHQFTKSKIDN